LLDDAAAGRQAGRVGGGPIHRPVHRLADASKNELKPWLKQQWVIPPEANAAFVANLFMAVQPLAGRRHVEVTQHKTAVDFARFLKRLSDEWYPDAERIVLVCDNLNTHCVASLYEAFEPAEARRLAERFEWHHTPKHGAWLNVAECELSVVARQCLDRRIPDVETLKREVAAWQAKRNATAVKVDWQFTTADARIKLKRLYPTVQLL
jgi:hypothetical protein